jgi:putative ABC transport system permease protein
VWRAALKSLLAHKLRLTLTAISIVLGVGFVSGTLILGDTLTKTFDELFEEVTAGTDVAVRYPSGFSSQQGDERKPVPASLLEVVRGVDGVAKAEGTLTGYAQLVGADGKAIETGGAPTLGVTYGTELSRQPLTIRDGRPPSGPTEIAVDVATARRHKLAVGQSVQVLLQGAPRRFTIVGTVRFGPSDGAGGSTLTVFDVATAQEVFERKDAFDAIAVQAEPGVSPEELRARIEAALPDDVEAVTGQDVADEGAESVEGFLSVIQTALLVFAFIAVFVGAFIIFNTFNILVTQRTRELALYRALGASRRQVMRSVISEAAIVGLLASAVGVGFGFLVAVAIKGAMSAFGLELPASGTVFQPSTAVISILVGVVVTVVASVLPAKRASAVPPVAAMQEEGYSAPPKALRRRTMGGVALSTLGALSLGSGLFGSGDSRLQQVGLGALLIFLGVAALSPLVARPMARVLGAPLAWFGVPGKLGRQNAERNPRRTAATASALMIGLALIGTVSVLAASISASLGGIIDKEFGADYIINAQQFQGHSAEVSKQISRQPGIDVAVVVLSSEFKVEGQRKFVSGMDPATVLKVLKLDVQSGSLTELRESQIMVSEDAAKELGVGVGDSLDVEFAATGEMSLQVVGVYAQNQLMGEYFLSSEGFTKNFTIRRPIVTVVKAREGVPATESRAQIESVLEAYPNLTLNDQAEYKEAREADINQLLGLIFALLGLAVIIAIFGIVNTLALSVLERTREIGLLRAVGMARRQVRRMIRYESVLISVIGATLGLAIGLLFGISLVRALNDEGITELAFPVGLLVACLFISAAAGVLAALFPAWRAGRLNVLRAISHT